MLPIPTTDPDIWYVKDLTDCSATEFEAWLGSVFPLPADNPSAFGREAVRYDVFKKVVNFHRILNISGSGKPKDPGIC